MSTTSNQPQLPKGFRFTKKMKRFLLFALFFGLFIFSMSLFMKARLHSHHENYSDVSVYKLAKEIKELKESQGNTKEWIEHLHRNQQEIVNEQNELNNFKKKLIKEVSKVEKVALQSQEAYNNIKYQLQEQEAAIKALWRNAETGKVNNQGNSQEKNQLLVQLSKTQAELANRLETFKEVLQGFEMKLNTNNRRISEEMRELKNWIGNSAATKEDLGVVIQSTQQAQRQLVNELNNQKSQRDQASPNNVKLGNEVKEISRVLNGLKDYTLEALQGLSNQNTMMERRLNNVERSRPASESSGKQSNEAGQLAKDLKNFKEYTLEALQELRNYQNKNTKKINHIQSQSSEHGIAPISEVVSQEVENFFNKLEDGKLLEKILEATNITTEELQTFVNIIKMLSEGDINGVLNHLNQLAGGDLMKQLTNAKEGLEKEFKPIVTLLNQVQNGDLNDVMKYASWINKFLNGDSDSETPSKKLNLNNKRQQKGKKREFRLEDILEWF